MAWGGADTAGLGSGMAEMAGHGVDGCVDGMGSGEDVAWPRSAEGEEDRFERG